MNEIDPNDNIVRRVKNNLSLNNYVPMDEYKTVKLTTG